MQASDFWTLIIVLGITALAAPFLGGYLARVFEGQRHLLSFLAPVEKGLYKLMRVDPAATQNWRHYLGAILAFSLVSLIVLWLILVGQKWLPFNPQGLDGMSWHLAFNTAVSFVTNTNWQAYSGETTLSHFAQAAGLTVQNFVSPAVGLAVAVALIRGLRNRAATGAAALGEPGLGNFWVDLVRGVLYVLLPLAIIVALVLVSQGVIQNLSGYVPFTTIDGQKDLLPMGPAASQIAIKQLGTNGGGFFGVNSAHPFENPTLVSNVVENIAILLIPAALPFLFGRMIGQRKQGYALFAIMAVLFVAGLVGLVAAEAAHGSLEGKEVRFGVVQSALWAQSTTVTSNGSVNAMHDSFSPLGGLVAMVNILLGEVAFGGVGSGFYGIVAYLIVAVFVAGLMVGRSPEYLGKRIEAREIQLSILILILPSTLILALSALSAVLPVGTAARTNHGPHGLSEILYAFTSGGGNNGSAFGGLSVNNTYYNVLIGLEMLVTRFGIIAAALGIAGSLAKRQVVPVSLGTLPTDGPVFVGWAVTIIVIEGALVFFPVMVLGPVLDHLLTLAGRLV